MDRRLSIALVAFVVLLGPLAVAGCSDDDGTLHATATFDDVADLAEGAPVMMADIAIGQVTDIRLDGSGRRATVDIGFDRSAGVPADVIAKVRRTSPLGEKFIDLEPQTDDLQSPTLQDGATIERTAVVSDLEQLISSGTSTFAALSGSQLAVLLDEGERAFGDKGPQLNTTLDQLASVADGYETRTDELTSIITDLDQLAGDLAPGTEANGAALANLQESMTVLLENDEEFYALVRSLNEVADDGIRILDEHTAEITTQLRALRDVTDAIAVEEASLDGVLRNLPRHNQTVPLAERSNFVHVLLDVILCGIPGGGDVPGDPVDACYPGEAGGAG